MSTEIDFNMKVLVVDDSKTMRRIVVTVLQECGFTNILTANDGKAAWPYVEEDDIGLILSDQEMPNEDGIRFLRRVRECEDTKCVPFIMITAEAYPENVMEALKFGVSDYIVKPFDTEQLVAKIFKVLKTSRLAEN